MEMTGYWQDIGRVLAATMFLLLFGVAYNALVAWVHARRLDSPFTSFMVVFGVGVTLVAAIPLIGLEAVLVLVLLFAASGTPMIAGALVRWGRGELTGRKIQEGILSDRTSAGEQTRPDQAAFYQETAAID